MGVAMNKLRHQLVLGPVIIATGILIWMADCAVAEASEKTGYDFPSSGVSTVLSPSSLEIETGTKEDTELNISEKFEAEQERMLTELAMANVKNTLNVRADASEDSSKVGYLYTDCGGTILEQKDGWTKIRSGALTGWCADEYLVFGDDAVLMAQDVGHWLVTIDSEAMRVRKEPSTDAEVMAVISKTDYLDFVDIINDDWISVEFEGNLGYLSADYVDIEFHIDEGETIEKVKARAKIEEQIRKEAEAKAKKESMTKKRAAVSADADELRLLAALIYCEAGNQSYEGMVAVGAVVMNRVKSPSYPNSIYSVIYASGQFSPAMSGKVASVYSSGVPALCTQAAAAALNGETTVGGATHFRRNNGRVGYVLGDHVFW